MTGDEFAKQIRCINPDIHIILCTGFSKKISPEDVHQFDIDALLLKPIVMRDMAKTLRDMLDKR